MSHARTLKVVHAGRMEYGACLALQTELHAKMVAGEPDPHLILVEHPPVLTFGKHADPKFMLFSKAALAKDGIAVHDTDRGGEITAHEPGQLVAYPILRLADFNLSPRRYVELLEGAVMRTLDLFGVHSAIDAEHPGVWVGRDKICAIGVRIKRRATLHGLALNVTNSLDLFQRIVPCGIQGRGVTSLARVAPASRAADVSIDRVAPVLAGELARALGVLLS